ncbi:MAG: RnfABCDGE type electron transport complex subunit G [Christensenella sp.]|uniref:RnfABCDGE type electron transport complex subunit G n=1 Tax=Christensenella sp. TaxID=1935934 RepID=UPI002B1FDA1B|nr:RnfABCDGE type electron transport complex subunit G [Christensenella sp.]MEA5002685.1 RnfABCDGE type electron transport complex subunit G [Christensenella sp.]
MNKTKSDSIFNLTIRLVIITVCAGLILGLVYGITKGPIAEQELKKATEARQAVLPDAQEFKQIALDGMDYDQDKFADINEIYEGTSNGQTVGYTFAVTTKGYKPGLGLTIGMASDGKITGVMIGSHEETPGLGANATNPSFLDQFLETDGPIVIAKSPSGAENEVQALTGATITSKGVANAVNLAREFAGQYLGLGEGA